MQLNNTTDTSYLPNHTKAIPPV